MGCGSALLWERRHVATAASVAKARRVDAPTQITADGGQNWVPAFAGTTVFLSSILRLLNGVPAFAGTTGWMRSVAGCVGGCCRISNSTPPF